MPDLQPDASGPPEVVDDRYPARIMWTAQDFQTPFKSIETYMEELKAKNAKFGIQPDREDFELFWRINLRRKFQRRNPLRVRLEEQTRSPVFMHHWVAKRNPDKNEHSDFKVIERGLPDQPFAIKMKDYEDKEVVLQDILITPLHRLPIRAFAENAVLANRDLSIGVTKLNALYQSVLNEICFYEPSSAKHHFKGPEFTSLTDRVRQAAGPVASGTPNTTQNHPSSAQLGQDASQNPGEHNSATEGVQSTPNSNGKRRQHRAIAKKPLLPSNEAMATQAASDDAHETLGGLEEVNRADTSSTQSKSRVMDTAPAVMATTNQARGDAALRTNEQLLKRKPSTDAGQPAPKRIENAKPRAAVPEPRQEQPRARPSREGPFYSDLDDDIVRETGTEPTMPTFVATASPAPPSNTPIRANDNPTPTRNPSPNSNRALGTSRPPRRGGFDGGQSRGGSSVHGRPSGEERKEPKALPLWYTGNSGAYGR